MEETNKKSALSTAALVLGIIAICIAFIPILNYLSIIMGILSIVFGLIGFIKKQGVGCATSGFILGIIAIALTINSYKTISDSINTLSDKLNNSTGINSTDTTNNEMINISSTDTITGKDVEITIEHVEFTQNVEPPVKSAFYTHYQVDDSSNTYLYAILNCKNISTIDLSSSSVANMTVKYKNDYTYNSFSTIPNDATGFTYSDLIHIKPLTSQKIYYLAEMPKSIADETDTPVDIHIKVDNKTYVYKYR